MRPVSSELRRDHARHAAPVENFSSPVENISPIPQPSIPPTLPRKTGTVKWTATRQNYTYLTMPDGRDVFLHRDDFDGEWPPRYTRNVEFKLSPNPTNQTCKFRAEDAKLTEPQ